jgi:copper transport protein
MVRWARLSLVALSAAAWVAALAPAAAAHSALLSSDPAGGASLKDPPTTIVLEFTEAPEPSVTRVEVLGQDGRELPNAGPAEIAPEDPRTVRLELDGPLPSGVYTVNWRVVSSIDGHVEAGSFAFGIGVVPPAGAGAGGLADIPLWLTVTQSGGRWLLYGGLALMIGAAATLTAVFAGSVPPGGIVLLRVAWLSAAIGGFVVLLAERAIIDVPSLLPLLHTTVGRLQGIEGLLVLACAAGVVAVDLYPHRWTLVALGALTASAMLLHVLSGHAFAPTVLRPLNLMGQWVHLMAVGVWVGGLAWLLLGVRRQRPEARRSAVLRFSTLAAAALAAVVLTGLLRAVAEVGSIDSLLTTAYGVTLLVKIALVVVLIALGALNRFALVPALAGRRDRPDAAPGAPPASESGAPGLRSLRWSVRSELVVAAAILAVTASLSGLAPARVASAGAGPPAAGVVAAGEDFTKTVGVRLTIAPGTVGANTFTVEVLDAPTGAVRQVDGVRLQFALPERPSLEVSTLSLTTDGGGMWTGEGLFLSAPGEWVVDALVQEPADAVVVSLTAVIGD